MNLSNLTGLTNTSGLSLTGILNRAQVLSTQKVYNYNKMECINSKPVLQKGGENLIEYNISVPLHCSFCNPETVIETLEEQAASGEAFEWIYNSIYMGTFVIDSIEKTVKNRIKDFVIFAEVTLNLLECPQDEEFSEQNTGETDIADEEIYSESSSKIQSFLSQAKNTITDNMTAAVLVSDNISDAGKELFTTISESVLSDASGVNITALYSKAEYWAEVLESGSYPAISDISDVIDAVRSIPDSMISAALRA